MNPPWTTAQPANGQAQGWAALTAYAQPGVMVSNAGNLYQLIVTGTSSAATPPTGTGVAPITTDGTCTWYYFGPVRAASAFPITPIVGWTSAAYGGVTNGQFIKYTTANQFFFSGGFPTDIGSGYRFPISNVAPGAGNAVGTYNASSPTITWQSDAPMIAIAGSYSFYAGAPLVLEVDGQFIQLGEVAPTSTLGSYLINWSGERKVRRYRLWLAANEAFYGVYIDTASEVWPDNNPNRYRIVFQGDSITGGAGGFPYVAQSLPDLFGYLVGCDDLYNCAAGGSGFISNNVGTTTTFLQRLPDIVQANPDVHIIFGNHNDSGYTSAQRIAAMTTYINLFIELLPTAKLVFFGTTTGGGAPAPFVACEQDIQTVVSNFNSPNIIFLPVSTDPNPWITGTGTVVAPTGVGNSDSYTISGGTHPVQGGIEYYARRMANTYIGYFNSLG